MTEKLGEKEVQRFRDGIYSIWFNTSGCVEDKIELCVRLFRRIIDPEIEIKYNKLLDDYDDM